jgi:DNA polymerase-3 subunit gamma/tau
MLSFFTFKIIMASYLALARKYRPRQFNELVGQQHTVTTLVNTLDNQTLHHAFLFTGTRGVGKTSIARIFAKALNCEEKISSMPCEKCSSCLEIASGSSLDLIELDAASHTGVDNMRDILDNAQYLPTKSRFKIYLIDEVHMLSTNSFNALLKTLEEPPEHIKFLFATTDPQKLPVTILSRCLQFNLQRISDEDIEKQLANILKKEEIKFEADSLKHIAKSADGSMRDALSLLDQIIAYCNNDIKKEAVIKILGVVNQSNLMELAQHIINKDSKKMLATAQEMATKGENLEMVLKSLMSLFYQLATVKIGNNQEKELMILAESIEDEALHLYYQIALQGLSDLKFAPNHQIGLEITLLRMITFTNDGTSKKKH